ncbi:MAG TPA: sigma 54-interacting transcriptional regulator [Polyangiaceae bacterium]|nr:sigma 54-interacting transcriptional regulator [Polyangiaceae bacterium]
MQLVERMQAFKVLELTRRVAQVDTTVLITGESGVGKERIARLIHDESARTGGAFVTINCGALPEETASLRGKRCAACARASAAVRNQSSRSAPFARSSRPS